MEPIVVDDRSTDRTGEILEQLANEDARLRDLRMDTLPEGWLGKCHACHVGASAARGEWLLFTDADCWSKPDVVLRALRWRSVNRRTTSRILRVTPCQALACELVPSCFISGRRIGLVPIGNGELLAVKASA